MSNDKKKDDIEELDFEDTLEIEDLELDVKVDNITVNGSTTGSDSTIDSAPLTSADNSGNDINSSPALDSGNDTPTTGDAVSSSNEATPAESDSNSSGVGVNDNMGTNGPERGTPLGNNDDGNLKNDAPLDDKNKQNDKPKSLKDRLNDAKDRRQQRRDKIKNAPDNLRKKRDDLKNKWDNRPKNAKELGKRVKNGSKQLGKNIKNNAKNALNKKAKEAIENNAAVQKVKKAKEAAETAKKAVRITRRVIAFLGSKVGLIIIGCVLIVAVITLIPSIIADGAPLLGGEVKEEENYSKYSEEDQKTIDALRKLTEKYAGDPSYAMAATLYPYIEEMQNGNVNSLRGKTGTEQENEEVLEEGETYDTDSEEGEETEEEQKDSSDTTANDPYLELFRERNILGQRTYLRKFEKLLKKSMGGEEALTSYLKETWFKKDKGYKELFDDASNEEELADEIIEDILSQKGDFAGYFFENLMCSLDYVSDGTVEIDDVLKGNILVDVKVSSCSSGSNSGISACESMYDSPIPLEKYVKGVTYEEIGVSGSSDVEKVKTQMVAAKSYAIGRSKSMGWDIKKTSDGSSYVIMIRANTNDQDYCDIDVGCSSGKTMVASGSRKRDAVDEETRAKLDEAWEATKNNYIYNESKKTVAGEFCNSRTGVCSFCKKGSCLAHQELESYRSTDFKTILGMQYSSYKLIEVEGDFATSYAAGTSDCSNLNGSDIDEEMFIYYSQNDYPTTPFCGRALGSSPKNGCSNSDSICTSGCGVTSTAMVVATLTQNSNVTPETINSSVRVGTDCGSYGSNGSSLVPYMAEQNGLTATTIETSVSALKQALDEGSLVIANVGGAMNIMGTYNTSGGHYIVIRGYNDNTAYVADPWQNTSLKSHCDSKNNEKQCVKAKTNIEKLVDNVKNHVGSGLIKVSGPIKFNTLSTSGKAGEATGTLGYPVAGVNGCDDSDYPNYSSGKYHGGTDINYNAANTSVEGKDVLAADGGVVSVKKELNYSYGNYIKIDHGNGYSTLYAHMKQGSITVNQGDKVKKGQKIGEVGSTGNSTGPHLHIELQKKGSHEDTLNPCKYMGNNKKYAK